MPLPYREFAGWILSDLAERTETEYADRIVFSGNHIYCQIMLPVQAENETRGQFASRSKDFRTRLPRRSDLSRRIALAMEAFGRAGEKTWSAASLILEELKVLR